MPWDDELKRLAHDVRTTFDQVAVEDAIERGLNAMRKAQPADPQAPFDANAPMIAAIHARKSTEQTVADEAKSLPAKSTTRAPMPHAKAGSSPISTSMWTMGSPVPSF